MSDMERAVSKGIADEKTRESIGVFKVIGAVILAIVVGSITNVTIGVAVMLGLMVWIWAGYSRR
jgi:hypothetical protein